MQQANCVQLFLEQAKRAPDQLALSVLGGKRCTFGELEGLAAAAQERLKQAGIKPGDRVLLLDDLGPRLYGAIVAVLALGATVIFVEPWMPLQKLNGVLTTARPNAFMLSMIGRLWGLRSSAARQIPKWIGLGGLEPSSKPLEVNQVEEDAVAVLTFTSGTTGSPKGVVRTHGTLIHQHQMLTKSLGMEELLGPDLTIFANFALSNLAAGRPSILVPPKWKKSSLLRIGQLTKEEQPVSLTCGPAFLLTLMREGIAPPLHSIHVGGALTDCWILEKGFAHWPKAHWTHVYGSSEAEPVAVAPAREAVEKSRKRGFFQTLYLGNPVEGVGAKQEEESAWVSGPHVCPYYIGAEEANRKEKQRDAAGALWHRMGDRILEDESGWWYGGRSGQIFEQFELEQKIYAYLQSSKSFLSQTDQGLTLVGEGVCGVQRRFPQIQRVIEQRICRDKRHRSRIDRRVR